MTDIKVDKVTFWGKFDPSDFIAFIIITGGMVVVATNENAIIGNMLTAVTFYYFGKKVPM